MSFLIAIAPFLVAALVVWALAMMLAWSYGNLGRAMQNAAPLQPSTESAADRHSVSIAVVMTVCNQAEALRRHLKTVLEQDYDDFEVIVVDMASTDDTVHVLEQFELDYPRLRHTYTPASARDISLERLALTLAIRMARSQWVVVTRADSEPLSQHWLRSIASEATDWRTLLVGASAYELTAPRRTHFDHVWATISGAGPVLSGKAAVLCDDANIAFRREAFLQSDGFAQHQDLRHAAIALMVNDISKPRATAPLLHADTLVMRDTLPQAERRRQQLMDIDTRSHLRHATMLRLTNAMRMLMPWIVLITLGLPLMMCILSIVVLSMPIMDAESDYSTTRYCSYAITGVLTLMLLVYAYLKVSAFNLTARALRARPLYLSFLYYELILPLHTLALYWRWWRTPHNEFRKKFV